jgi:hypothetical protein
VIRLHQGDDNPLRQQFVERGFGQGVAASEWWNLPKGDHELSFPWPAERSPDKLQDPLLARIKPTIGGRYFLGDLDDERERKMSGAPPEALDCGHQTAGLPQFSNAALKNVEYLFPREDRKESLLWR